MWTIILDTNHEVENNGLAEAKGSRNLEMEGDNPSIDQSELLRSRTLNVMEKSMVLHHLASSRNT